VTALAGSLIAGMLTIHLLRPVYLHSDAVSRPFSALNSFGNVLPVQLALLLLPLAILSGNALFVPNCDFADGLALFSLLPVVSVIFASALGLMCTVHYTHPRLVFAGFASASIVYVLLLGYWSPAIFSYNFFYGYFPGLTYDELLPVGQPLVLFRAFTLGVALFLVWTAHSIVQQTAPGTRTTVKGIAVLRTFGTRYLAVSMALILGMAVLFIFRCQLGWESTRTYIRTTLGGVVETGNFTIYFDSAATKSDDIRFLAREHEFRLQQVLEAFALPRTEHITTYVYPSADTKRRLIGAGETEVAKPWSREVHLTRSSVDNALKHELVHIVAAPFGVPVMKASFSPGLTEGLAVAVEGSWAYRTLAQHAAALRMAGIAPSIRALMTPAGFMATASSMSYVLAGAFCRHLVDSYGMRPLLQVYRSGDYVAAYDKPLDSLIAEWHRALDSVKVSERDRASVDVIFRRPPIFGKVCARVHARRLRDAQRFLRQRRYDEAHALYATLYAEGGSYEALSGLLFSYFRKGDYSALTHMYDSVTTHDPVPRRYLILGILAGDAAWASGKLSRAESLYAQVRAGDISPGLTESAFVRQWALSENATASRFLPYIVDEMSDSARVSWLGMMGGSLPDPLRSFLRGRLLLRMGLYDEAAYALLQAGTIADDPAVEALRQRSIGDALLRSGRTEEARAWYWTSMNYDARPYVQEIVHDRVEYCEWLGAQPPSSRDR